MFFAETMNDTGIYRGEKCFKRIQLKQSLDSSFSLKISDSLYTKALKNFFFV